MRGKGVVLLALLSSLTLTGCGRSTRVAQAFNQAIVAGNQTLEKADQDFGEALGTALRGGPADVATARRLYEVACQALRTVQSDARSLRVPPSQAARDLYDAYQGYLAGEERMLLQDLGEVMSLLENTRLDDGERTRRVAEILTRMEGTEASDLAKLIAAQQTFAREYDVTLRNPQGE